jgi:hypothetical protein
MANQGASDLCPPPQVHLNEGELEAAVESALRGDVELSAVDRERDDSQVERMADGTASVHSPYKLDSARAVRKALFSVISASARDSQTGSIRGIIDLRVVENLFLSRVLG